MMVKYILVRLRIYLQMVSLNLQEEWTRHYINCRGIQSEAFAPLIEWITRRAIKRHAVSVTNTEMRLVPPRNFHHDEIVVHVLSTERLNPIAPDITYRENINAVHCTFTTFPFTARLFG